MGGLEGPRRASAVLPDDAGARRTCGIRRIPEENRKRSDEHMSPLRWRRGHGPAHVAIVSDVGGPTYSMASDWREIKTPRQFWKWCWELMQQELLVVRSYCEDVMLVKERTEWERVRASYPCRVPCKDGPALPKECSLRQEKTQEEDPAVIRKRCRGISAEHQAVHRGVLVRKVWHYLAACQKSGGCRWGFPHVLKRSTSS